MMCKYNFYIYKSYQTRFKNKFGLANLNWGDAVVIIYSTGARITVLENIIKCVIKSKSKN